MEFNIGDRIHKNNGVCSGKDGTVKNILNDGTLAVNFDGEKINRYCDPAACTACNADYKVGDKVMVRKIVGFTPTAPKPATITQVYGSDGKVAYKCDDGTSGVCSTALVSKNASARRAVTVVNAEMVKVRHDTPAYVGDKVRIEDGDGVIESITQRGMIEVRMKSGNFVGKVVVASPKDATVINAINPAIKAEYEAFKKADAAYKKWWNPDRKLSAHSKASDDYTKAMSAFSRKYHDVYGKWLPNGWGQMDLEGLLSVNAKFKVGDTVRGKLGGDKMTIAKVGSGSGDDLVYQVKNKDGDILAIEERNLVACNGKFKVGDRVKFMEGPIKGEFGKVIKINPRVDGVYDVQSSYGEILTNTPERELAKVRNAESSVLAEKAVNAPHFSGPGNDLAEKIAKQYMKWEKSKDADSEKKLWELIRSASSLGGGVWVMRDGTIAIAPTKPRGAEPIKAYINADPETAPVAKNGYRPGDGNLHDVNGLLGYLHGRINPQTMKMESGDGDLKRVVDQFTAKVNRLPKEGEVIARSGTIHGSNYTDLYVLTMGKDGYISVDGFVKNAVAKNAEMTADQVIATIKAKTKILRDINAKVIPWRKEMEKMRKVWDNTNLYFIYGLTNFDELRNDAKINGIMAAEKEFRSEQDRGYYNFYSI